MLLELPVFEFSGRLAFVSADLLLDAVVAPLVALIPNADATQDVVDIRVGEAETEKQERLLDEVPTECRNERLHFRAIGFVVVLANHRVGSVLHITVHLVNCNVTILPGDGDLLERILHIGNLFGTFEGFLDQLVVIGRPIGVYRKLRQNPVILCGRFCRPEVIEDRLRQLGLVSAGLIAVILRKCDEIVLLIRVQAKIARPSIGLSNRRTRRPARGLRRRTRLHSCCEARVCIPAETRIPVSLRYSFACFQIREFEVIHPELGRH